MSSPVLEYGTTNIAVSVAIGIVAGYFILGVLSYTASWIMGQVRGIITCGKMIVVLFLMVILPVMFVSASHFLPYACKGCTFYKMDYLCPPVLQACDMQEYIYKRYKEFNIPAYTKTSRKKKMKEQEEEEEEQVYDEPETVNDIEEEETEKEREREKERARERKQARNERKQTKKKEKENDKETRPRLVPTPEQEYDI